MNVSEIARIIAAEYMSAKTGLGGLAYGTSRHQFITARMENMKRCRERLNALVGEREGTEAVYRDTREFVFEEQK
jgi:hypothetical protein